MEVHYRLCNLYHIWFKHLFAQFSVLLLLLNATLMLFLYQLKLHAL